MTLYMFTHTAVSILKDRAKENKEEYQNTDDWIKEYLTENTLNKNDWYVSINSQLDLSDLKLHFDRSNKEGEAIQDLRNIKIFFGRLKELPLDIATDERFWSYLTHVTFRDYVQQRWGKEDNNLLEHYFFKANKTEGDRALLRNAMARLWWYGYLTHDEKRTNPFELTEYLFRIIDFAQQFGERTYSRNPVLARDILTILKDEFQFSPQGTQGRLGYRKVFKDINQAGGVKVLDFLDYEDIRGIIRKSLEVSELGLVTNS